MISATRLSSQYKYPSPRVWNAVTAAVFGAASVATALGLLGPRLEDDLPGAEATILASLVWWAPTESCFRKEDRGNRMRGW